MVRLAKFRAPRDLFDVEALVSALPDPLLAIDDMGTIIFANVAAEGFFQTSATLLKRFRLSEVVPFASPLLSLVDQVRQTGSTIHEYAVDVGTPRTGGERVVDLQVAMLTEDPPSVLIVLQPRSMAHKIDRQLTHRNAARSVTGMASMLAHEIKNPLSGIRGAAQLLEPALSGEDRALTRLICEETDRICTLVDQMEVFSDERPVDLSPVNIHSVLDHVKAIAASGFGRGVKISEEYDPSLPPVMANRDQLIQVFVNLLKNAAEAIQDDGGRGEIILSTAFRPGMRLKMPGSTERVTLPLEYCVHDTGPGIPDELIPHLFDPFVTTKPSGKGLGLALVAKIIRDHGGIVECNSQEGRTTFRILMPMHAQPIIEEI
ncbi:two-component system nitrogen regulation sensor histidine kinase GlnL [Rhodoligotrophos appendicifer]|uniref:two-component system sensor histidine kinase NtrB n=1 Tax=Rhodoligotrophos appendicifer TaxID=987056 RepID=UPI0011849D62|nr:ATP-binding protein [Rhodoligotrophos appendicifer]